VIPVEYEETCPYIYNNFIYKIQLSQPLTPTTFSGGEQRAGTSVPPDLGSGASNTVILRLSNPHAEGLNNAHRVENELASQHLFRQQLSAHHPGLAHLIPAVYAWQPSRYSDLRDETGFGWTICEFMPGVNLNAQFDEMDLPEKLAVVEQVADILAALQRTIPPTLLATGHLGGLTFDGSGQVVGGQTSILPPGPWENYAEMWLSRLLQQVHEAERSSALKGWQEVDGVRARIDSSITADTVARLVQGVDTTQRTLVHGDFCKSASYPSAGGVANQATNVTAMGNMLFDTSTKKVTALLDFDFSWVSHPAHEFITGLWDVGGGLQLGDEKLQEAVFSGRFDGLEDDGEAPSADSRTTWEVAKAWDSALAARDAIRPSKIQGIRQVQKLMTLEGALCPHQLSSVVRIERLRKESPEKLAEAVKRAADRLMTLLDDIAPR